MTTSDRSGIIAKMQAHSDNRHGDIYRWLKKHRRAVEDGFKSTGAGWEGVVAALAEAGVTGRDGTPANRKSVRRVWARVCADLEAAAAAQNAKKAATPPAFRTRQNPQWQPPQTQAARQPTGHRAVSSAPPTDQQLRAKPEELAGDVKSKLAAVKRQFAWMDRHIVQQPDEE